MVVCKGVGLQVIRKRKQKSNQWPPKSGSFPQGNLRSTKLDCLNPKYGLFLDLEYGVFSMYNVCFYIPGSCHLKASRRLMLHVAVLLREVVRSREGWVAGRSVVRVHTSAPQGARCSPTWLDAISLRFPVCVLDHCASRRGEVRDWNLHLMSEDMESRTRT